MFQIPPEDVIKHEQYKVEGGIEDLGRSGRKKWVEANDIALIRLARPVQMAPHIIPACLPLNEVQSIQTIWQRDMLHIVQDSVSNMQILIPR